MKFKNMIYLTISYIPWIVYWTLSAQLKPYGSIVAVILEILILTKQMKDKEYSYIEVFSLIYFLIASICIYMFNMDIFIRGDGYIGYGTLFLISLFGIIFNKPFMKYYVQKDLNDVSVIKKKSNFQTIIWSAIFFIDTFVFMLIKLPVFAVILSNVFVCIGIILSIYDESK